MARITCQLTLLLAGVFLQSYVQAEPLERILNGQFARPKQFPHQVYFTIQKNATDYRMCSGTIISKWSILSAAHCFTNFTSVEIIFGALDINNPNEVGQQCIIVTPKNIRTHENFNRTGLLENDIALIKLPNSLTFNDYIKSALLPEPNNNYDNRTFISSGWGKINDTKVVFPKQLMYFSGLVLTSENCKNNFFKFNTFLRSWICMDAKYGHSLGGDSGGPVIVENNNSSVTLIGIISYGEFLFQDGPLLPGFPTMATRVSSFLDWIKIAYSTL